MKGGVDPSGESTKCPGVRGGGRHKSVLILFGGK